MKPKVYIDSSVIGGYYDDEFMIATQSLFKDFELGLFIPIISDITIAELGDAPSRIRNLLESNELSGAIYVEIDEEADELAKQYISNNVITDSSLIDAQHIAIATVKRVDILVSWNFKHIVKWDRIRAYNSVNLKLGYPELEIRSPMEVYYEK